MEPAFNLLIDEMYYTFCAKPAAEKKKLEEQAASAPLKETGEVLLGVWAGHRMRARGEHGMRAWAGLALITWYSERRLHCT